MSARDCTRAWQAEARQDGRLSPADAASFERHATTCDSCRREVSALAELAAHAERLAVLTSTPLEHRRLRNELLRRANEQSTHVAPSPKLARFAWLAGAALMIAAASAVLLMLPSRSTAPGHAPPSASAAPAYQATASPNALWHTREYGRVLRLALARGQLELSVEHLHADQRFIVELPDGELEVKGTRFVVQADGAHTLAVRVIEGRVALRLRGQAAALLTAGDAFAAPATADSGPTAPVVEQSARPKIPATTNEPRRAHASTDAPPEPVPKADPAPAPNEAPPRSAGTVPPTESTFSLAMAAFSGGDFGRADELFARFEHEHPGDTRIEDALFLRAVARARRGDESGARAIARDYLARFPHGLRSRDAKRLAGKR